MQQESVIDSFIVNFITLQTDDIIKKFNGVSHDGRKFVHYFDETFF